MTYQELIDIGYGCYPEDGDFKHPVSLHKGICDSEYPSHLERCARFCITKEEYFSILMLEGWDYDVIQESCYNESPSAFQTALIELLDSALEKIPSTSSRVLYRQERYQDIEHLRELFFTHTPLRVAHYLTCSADDFDNCALKLVITPLGESSRARDIHLVRNQGEELPYPENQVEFMRGTSFLIDDIREPESGRYVVHCHELAQP